MRALRTEQEHKQVTRYNGLIKFIAPKSVKIRRGDRPGKKLDAAKHKAAVAAGHGKWEKDLALHYPERLWVTLLRMHYRPVHPVRKDIYSTTTLKSYGGTDGHEIWRVGESYMSKDEAIHLAEQLEYPNSHRCGVYSMSDSATASSNKGNKMNTFREVAERYVACR